MYQDAPAADIVYVLNDAEIAYAVVEDQERSTRCSAHCGSSTGAYLHDDPRGLRNYRNVTSFERLQDRARYDRAGGFYGNRERAADDVAIMLYIGRRAGRRASPGAPR
jgi:long-chain acyl-CoA synthetase